MKNWWLLGILTLILLFWGVREGFENTTDIQDAPKCPDGSTNYKQIPRGITYCEDNNDAGTNVCPSGYVMGGGDKCYPGDASTGFLQDDSKAVPKQTCPSGTTQIGDKCKKITEIKCPTGSSLAGILPNGTSVMMNINSQLKCVSDNISNTYPTNPLPPTPDPTFKQCNGDDSIIVYSGKPIQQSKCLRKNNTATTTTTTGGSTTTTGINATGTTGTTSGTTGTGVTPSTVRKSTVLGPVFTSYGAPIEVGTPDSHKSNKYPELLGGGDPNGRGMRGGGGGFGIGIGGLTGALPTAEGLGATEASRYFPFSRQPGDMELIPDPYRVSQQFSSASYSFKTEPSPFLTDFSAFLR